MFSRIDEENLINELPPNVKEILFFHQYGNIIVQFEFLTNLPVDAAWSIVKKMKKITFDKGDKIYEDNQLCTSFYLIH